MKTHQVGMGIEPIDSSSSLVLFVFGQCSVLLPVFNSHLALGYTQ